jgi:hypothetical protein
MDVFVAKYRADGTPWWLRRFGSPGDDVPGGGARSTTVAIASDGSVLFGITANGTLDFGGGARTRFGATLVKYSATGQYGWAVDVGSNGAAEVNALACGEAGSVVVAGAVGANETFSGTAVTPSGDVDGFVAKYTLGTGALQWVRRYGGTTLATVTTFQAVAVNVGVANGLDDDPIVVGGQFTGNTALGTGSVVSGYYDAFVVMYGSTGQQPSWQRVFGGSTADDQVRGVACDSARNVVIGGWATGPVDFGSGPRTGPGMKDFVLAKYTVTGTPLWGSLLGTWNNDTPGGVATDPGTRDVVFVGHMLSAGSLGGPLLYPRGANDILVAHYAE